MSSLNTIRAVADNLAARGYRATNEYPGVVYVLTERGMFVAGDVNEWWAMDYYPLAAGAVPVAELPTVETERGNAASFVPVEYTNDPTDVADLAIPRESEDAAKIADAIATTIQTWSPR